MSNRRGENPGRPRERPDAEQQTRPSRRSTEQDAAATGSSADTLRLRSDRYLFAPMPRRLLPPTVPPIPAATLLDQLERDPTVRVLRTVQPSTAQQARRSEQVEIIVAETTAERAAALATSPQIYIEPDAPIGYGSPSPDGVAALGITRLGTPISVQLRVSGSDGGPLADAAVYVTTEAFPGFGVTGSDGRATVALAVESLDEVRDVHVLPRHDHWSVWLSRPDLSPTESLEVVCPALSTTFPGFPGQAIESWTRHAMGFDRLQPTYRGHGVRIAVIDSGADPSHPDLQGRIVGGWDVHSMDDKAWEEDTIGCGTHCAGLITAVDSDTGMVGLAPETEVFVCKVTPGRCSDIIDALDHCIAAEVDLVTICLGGEQPSLLLASKIEEARQAGIACIAAAGDTGGPVAFPAALPIVLAVGALGKVGEYPAQSSHALQLTGTPTAEGYFLARDSALGPEVDVWAPGVAVVSTVPQENYAAVDGTAAAAAHVAGLAGLILAHHPDFGSGQRARTAARVDRLFQIILASCRPVPFADRGFIAGLPDAVIATGLVHGHVPPSVPFGTPVWAAGEGVPGLGPLRAAMRSAGLATEEPAERA